MSENSAVATKRKNALLPILTVLFLISYGIMTMLIVEQGNTIEAQRLLIKQLFSDSAQLSAMKGHEAQKRYAEKTRPKPFVHPQPAPQPAPQARPRQSQPRVDSRQAPADPQRSLVSL